MTTLFQAMKIDEIVQEWYAEFVSIEGTLLFQLMTAANYLAIGPLVDLTCLALAVLTQISLINHVFCLHFE